VRVGRYPSYGERLRPDSMTMSITMKCVIPTYEWWRRARIPVTNGLATAYVSRKKRSYGNLKSGGVYQVGFRRSR